MDRISRGPRQIGACWARKRTTRFSEVFLVIELISVFGFRYVAKLRNTASIKLTLAVECGILQNCNFQDQYKERVRILYLTKLLKSSN